MNLIWKIQYWFDEKKKTKRNNIIILKKNKIGNYKTKRIKSKKNKYDNNRFFLKN